MFALVTIAVAGAASAQDIRTTIDGKIVNYPDLRPIMMNERVMVPVRGVFEHMHATVIWEPETRTVIALHGGDEIRLPLNSPTATINGVSTTLDAPATIYRGRTLVPLRFIGEASGARVEWIAATRTVEISTTNVDTGNNNNNNNNNKTGYTLVRMDTGTVIPFMLNQKLTSNGSRVGDKFTANLDTGAQSNYQDMPVGTILEGHVDMVKGKTSKTPGVLGLAFDRVRLPDNKTYNLSGTLIGLDENSVVNENGRLVAKPGTKNDNLKYVGIGAGGGALLSILTKGNLITETLLGGALGYLLGTIQKDPSVSRDVTSDIGMKFGVRLTHDLSYRVIVTKPITH